jgi:hypothetical protein
MTPTDTLKVEFCINGRCITQRITLPDAGLSFPKAWEEMQENVYKHIFPQLIEELRNAR